MVGTYVLKKYIYGRYAREKIAKAITISCQHLVEKREGREEKRAPQKSCIGPSWRDYKVQSELRTVTSVLRDD